MRNNFYNQGTNIIAHHYFNLEKKTNPIRYVNGLGPQIVTHDLPRFSQPYSGEQSGYMGEMAGTGSTRPNKDQDTRSATHGNTQIIKSMGEVPSILKNGQSGQTLDLRDHNISPEVYMALARGEAVEVQLQQMAPERVNLFTPMLASVMQIFGGMSGGVAYNEDLSQVITGRGGSDKGQLGKAAEFVNRHGSAYAFGLGTGEHIDVVAKFRVLNQEGARRPPVTKDPVTPFQPPKDEKRDDITYNEDDVSVGEESDSAKVYENPTTESTPDLENSEPPKPQQIDPLTNKPYVVQPPPYKPIVSANPNEQVGIINIPDGQINVAQGQSPDVRINFVDNGTPLIDEEPKVSQYKYVDPQGNGKTLDANAKTVLNRAYSPNLGSSGEVNSLSAVGKTDIAASSSTIRGMSPHSNKANGSAKDWYNLAINSNPSTYPVKAAQDYLKLGVQANIVSEADLKRLYPPDGNTQGNMTKDPIVLGEVFGNVENTLKEKYNLCDSGNLGAAHIAAMEAALIDSAQALNGAATITTIAASQGDNGVNKINALSKLANGNFSSEDISKILTGKLVPPGFSQDDIKALTSMNPSETQAFKDLSSKDIKNAFNYISGKGVDLNKVATGDMKGVSNLIDSIEGRLVSMSDTIASTPYDCKEMPQYQQLKKQIDLTTGGRNSDSGSIDSLKKFIDFKANDPQNTLRSLSNQLAQLDQQGKLLTPSEMNEAKSILNRLGKELGLSEADLSQINLSVKEGKLDLSSLPEALRNKISNNPSLKEFVKSVESISRQEAIGNAEKELQQLQDKFNKGLPVTKDDISKIRNFGNSKLSEAINELSGKVEARNVSNSDNAEINNINNIAKLVSEGREVLTEQLNILKNSKRPEAQQLLIDYNDYRSALAVQSQSNNDQTLLSDASQAAVLLNRRSQGQQVDLSSPANKDLLKKFNIDGATISKIQNGDLAAIQDTLKNIGITAKVFDQNGKSIEVRDKDGKVNESATNFGKQLEGAIAYSANKTGNITKQIDNIISEASKFNGNVVVSSEGKTMFSNAINSINNSLISQLPKEIRDKVVKDNKIDVKALADLLASPEGNTIKPESLKNNLSKFVEATNKVSEAISKVGLTSVRGQYNTAVGGAEYLDKFVADLEKNNIDTKSLKNTDGSLNYDKVYNLVRQLSSLGNPPSIDNLPENATNTGIISDIYNKLKNNENNPNDDKLSFNEVVDNSKSIKDKFNRFDLGRSFDEETVDLIKSYGFSNQQLSGGVDIISGDVTRVASSVTINETTLKDSRVMNMITDSFKIALNSKDKDGNPLLRDKNGSFINTQDQLNKAIGNPPDPTKVFDLFRQMENKLSEMYNGAAHDPNKVNLTTDRLFGAFHITNLQRTAYESTALVRKGVQALDTLYEGKSLSSQQSQELDKLIKDYNASGKTPKINSIDELKTNKDLASSLLNFSKEKLQSISDSIGKYEAFGQLAELKSDINNIINGRIDSKTGLRNPKDGIVAFENAIKSGANLDQTQTGQSFQTKIDSEIAYVKDAVSRGVTSINGKSTSEYLNELKAKYVAYQNNHNIPSNDPKVVATMAEFNKVAEVASKPSPSTNAKDFQSSLKNRLVDLKNDLASGVHEVNVDMDRDGKVETVKIPEYLKKLEQEYQMFLLQSSPGEKVDVQGMANLFSEVHYDAGMALGNKGYSEVHQGFALALEAMGNVDVDNLFGSRGGKQTVNDSTGLTHAMINQVMLNAMRTKFNDCFDENTGTTDKGKLNEILKLSFKNVNDAQALQVLAITERLLKSAKYDDKNGSDLTQRYQDLVASGKKPDEALNAIFRDVQVKFENDNNLSQKPSVDQSPRVQSATEDAELISTSRQVESETIDGGTDSTEADTLSGTQVNVNTSTQPTQVVSQSTQVGSQPTQVGGQPTQVGGQPVVIAQNTTSDDYMADLLDYTPGQPREQRVFTV